MVMIIIINKPEENELNRNALVPLAAAAVLTLTGCSQVEVASDAQSESISIVASTNVYGDIAATIAGERAEVTSIIKSPAQDPHSFEGNARIQLALSTADIVIQNGGGYDDWATTLLAGANNESAVVLTVSDISGYDQAEGFNEHVWYDLPTMERLVSQIASELSELEPDSASDFEANADAFISGLNALALRESALAEIVAGAAAAITEPVPGYLLEAAGFVNVTPGEFSEAIEEGSDVPPKALEETLNLFRDGTAAILVYNEQTTGPATEQVLQAARDAGTPVVGVTETLPGGVHYLDWMAATLDALEAAMQLRS